MDTAKITRTISFKLCPTPEQAAVIDQYAQEYSKAVRFALLRIHELRKDWESLPPRKRFEAKCSFCGENTVISWQFRDKSHLSCSKCYNARFGDLFVRKLVYPTKTRRVEHRMNIKNVSNLSGSDFPLAINHAISMYKSLRELTKRHRFSLMREEEYSARLLEVVEDREIEVPSDVEVEGVRYTAGQKITAREVIPAAGRQRTERWIHRLRLTGKKPSTEKQIRKRLQSSQKKIRRLRKALESKPVFKSTRVINIHKNSLKTDKLADNKVKLLGLDMALYAINARNPKSREWYKKVVEEILRQEKTSYPTLLIKDEKGEKEYYLQYPLTTEHEIPAPDTSFRALGIDRGINQVAVYVVINKKYGKPHDISFESGRQLLSHKRKYDLIRKKFTGTKNRLKRFRPYEGKAARVSEQLMHQLSHKIVELAKAQKPIVIVMEKLSDIRESPRAVKYNKKTERKINYLLSNFVYGKLQTMIEYKARREGIPVAYVPAAYTSKRCSHPSCHNIDPNNRDISRNASLFKCTKCGRTMNADLNASINIANRFYELLEDRDNLPTFKDGILMFSQGEMGNPKPLTHSYKSE